MKIQTLNSTQLNDIPVVGKQSIIYYFDQLTYGEINKEINLELISEAFIFDQESCLHIYREEDLKAVLFEYEVEDEYVEEIQIGRVSTAVEHIYVRKLIAYDEDGQAYYKTNLPFKLDMKKEVHS